MLLQLATCILLCFPAVQSARVLFVVTAPIPRHQIIHQFIWEAVAERGHDVTVITSYPLRDFGLPDVTEIDVGSLYEKFFYKLKPSIDLNATKPTLIEIANRGWKRSDAYSAYAERILTHPNVKKFLDSGEKFDVCVIESNFPAAVAFATKVDCVLIITSSSGYPRGYLSTFGGPYYVPTKLETLGWLDKLQLKLCALYEEIAYRYFIVPREDKIVKEIMGENTPYLGDIQRNASLLIVNEDRVLEPAISLPTSVVTVRVNPRRPKGYMHLGLHTFMNVTSEGAVGLDLDPYFKSIKLPVATRDIIRDAFSNLPYFFVWHWEKKQLPGHPINVYIADWIPKYDFLAHEYTRLLITSGDLESIDAAVSNHIPILGIPLCYEHAENLEKYLKHGIGKSLLFSNLTEEALSEAIKEVIENPVYKKNTIKLDTFLRENLVDGVNKTVWWIEYVIRNNGTTQLKQMNVEIAWYEFYLLDVIGFLFSLLFLLAYILIKICRYSRNCLFAHKRKIRDEKKIK